MLFSKILNSGLDKYESALESSRSNMDTLLCIVNSDREEMEERLKESQLIGSTSKTRNEEHESRITEFQKGLNGMNVCTRFRN